MWSSVTADLSMEQWSIFLLLSDSFVHNKLLILWDLYSRSSYDLCWQSHLETLSTIRTQPELWLTGLHHFLCVTLK